MIVTFIYKLGQDNTKYYGKYIGYVSSDYEEGLDKEITSILYHIFEKEYGVKNIEDIVVGVLGFARDTYDYFSENEANIFDLLYCDWSNQEPEIYLNGKLLKSYKHNIIK